MTIQYCSVEQVLDYLGLKNNVEKDNRGMELVDNSSTITSGKVLYMKNANILTGSLVIYHGTSESDLTELTVITDYTQDLVTGKITITSDGATAIGTDNVYSNYDYIASDLGKTEAEISEIIDQQTYKIDEDLGRTWQPQVLIDKELQGGKGLYDSKYRTRLLPINFVKTTLGADVAVVDTEITLADTTGLEAGDYLSINGEAVLIDSVDDGTTLTVTRAQKGTTATTHTSGDYVVNIVVEVSYTPIGSTPTYNFRTYAQDYTVDGDTWYIDITNVNTSPDTTTSNIYPQKNAEDTLRITYKHGTTASQTSEVVSDIQMLCVLMTSKMLYTSQVLNALSRGTNGFVSEGISSIREDIRMIKQEHYVLLGEMN